jgi:peptidase C25-like protein/VCBS repeat protein/flagellar hook capping protein FlgD
MKLLRMASAAATLLTLTGTVARSATLERDFVYGAGRFQLGRNADGTTEVAMTRAIRDFTPGHPDLPLVGERVELPAGMKVTGVQVVAIETAPLARAARLPSAVVMKPGLGPVERTAPDPQLFGHAGFLPEAAVALGVQGDERGHNVAYLQVAPVRWNPATGALERVARLRVRLELAAGGEAGLRRERVVPEWEGTTAAQPPAAGSMAMVPGGHGTGSFAPTQIPSVLGSPVAYVILTGDDQVTQFQRLADWKTQTGVPAVVRTMSFVRTNYPFGSDDAERVRMFIRDAYTRWGTKWVLLGGDTDVIPVRHAVTTFYGGEDIATDLYYSCLDGNWNANGDSTYGDAFQSNSIPGDNVDLLPEVYVGRAPTSSAADAQLFVNKTLQYEKTPLGDYEHRLLFFAEVLFPQDWVPGQGTSLDGAELVEEVLPSVSNDPCMHFARLYENYTDPRWIPGALQEKRQTVIDSLNTGFNLAVHVGHGYRNVMSVGDNNLTNTDAMALHNGNRLTNLYAIDCTSNAIDFPCIGEAFLKAPNGGAVTNIGSTRFDFPTAGRSYQKEYFRLVFEDSVNAVGEAQARQKLPFVAFSTYDGVNRWTQMTLLMLGDPELRLWTCDPRTLQVSAPGSIGAGDASVPVTVAIGGQPLYGARVTLYKAGDLYATGLTDGNGAATLPVHIASTGAITLTVTGFNCRPYQATITVGTGSTEALGALAPTIDDDNVGGTQGDGNGQWDAGEVVDLNVPVRNVGAIGAPAVSGTLSTTDPLVTITAGTASYGTLTAGAQGGASPAFRASVPLSAPDQHEVPFELDLSDGNGRSYTQTFQVTLHAPDLRHNGHAVIDVGGNSNGRVDPGETINYFMKLRNLGTGTAHGVTAVLRSLDGLSTVTDSTSSFGDLAPGQEAQGDVMVFSVSSTSAQFQLRVSDAFGLLWVQTLDVVPPGTPTALLGLGAATSITLTWTHNTEPDLLGYNVYRSSSAVGPFVKVNPVPTDRTSYYLDGSLAALTRYYYKVSAVDSSSNESALSAVMSTNTNPPLHAIFPVPTGRQTPAPVAVDHFETGYPMDIAAGSDWLYVWRPDGTAPVDADGSGSTNGDFFDGGSYYAAGPSIGVLTPGGKPALVAPSWETLQVFALDNQGNFLPGWPQGTQDELWSGVAIGDLDGDGSKELVTASRGPRLYAWHANGQEVIDGDNNPGTTGVFHVMNSGYNDGTPALAPLEGGNQLDIVYGSFDGNLYAWRPNGTNVPGFPVHLGASISGSVAVGYLDGPGDPRLDIVVPALNDSLYVIEANGARHVGFPRFMRLGGTSKTPSPALADMNGDGYTDIIQATTNGIVYCWSSQGILLYPWNVRYSALTSGASESSPVVADINGDGIPDVVMGDENGQLDALSGLDGSTLPGFPIQLAAEVKGTPALCDCDGDGKTEIVVAGWDRNVYVWDYDFPFSPGKVPPWPQFHHDAQRTGYALNLPWAGVDDPSSAGAPRVVEFAPPAPNPTRATTRLAWSIPAAHEGERFELAVYDLSGRRLHTVSSGAAHAGRFSMAWDLRDDSGALARTGVYFARLTVGAEQRTHKLLVVR